MPVDAILKKEKFPFFNRNGIEKKVCISVVDIQESPDEYILTAAAPGFRRENFEITISDQIIIISAIKQPGTSGCVKDRHECDYCNWGRPFLLPDDADAILANATYRDGELIIRVPKRSAEDMLKGVTTVYVY